MSRDRTCVWAGIVSVSLLASALVHDQAHSAYVWEQHLHGTDVRDLVATNDALWLATLSGLVRFDLEDSSLTVFRRDARGMPSDSVNALAVDADGNVWSGTESAGIAIRRAEGGWDFVRTFDGLPSTRVLALAARGGQMSVGTAEGFAVFSDGDVSGCTVIDPCVDEMPSLIVQAVLPLQDETWFGTAAGPARQDGEGIVAFTDGLDSESVLALEVHEGEIWCGTANGPYRFDDTLETWVFVEGATRSVTSLVADLLSTPDGVYAAVPSGGPRRVYRWDGADWSIVGLNFEAGEAPQALALDGTGRLWTGTQDGIRAWSEGSGSWTDPIRVPGLTDPRAIWSIEVASQGRAWIGHIAPIAASFDGTTWTEITEASSGGQFENRDVQALYRDHRGRTWFGHCCCEGPGCFTDRLAETARGEEWARIPARNSRVITSDGGDLYFFGSGAEDPSVIGEGLSIWHESFPDDSVFVIRDDEPGFAQLSSNTITGLAFGPSGRLWIGHRVGGVDVWEYGADPFDPSDDSWQHLSQGTSNPAFAIISDAVLDVAASGTRVWISTIAGVTLVENGVSRGSWGQSTIGNPFVTSMATTDDGSAWAGTPDGVVRFVPNALGTFDREFYRFPQLTNDAVNAIAASGLDVWVATERGLSVGRPGVDPADVSGGSRSGSAYPNPFRPRQHDGVRLVDVTVSVDGTVYDAAGGLVAEFRDVQPGDVVWDGRITSDEGLLETLAAPGIYAIVARAGDLRITARVALIR